MIGLALLLSLAAEETELRWQGQATVHAGERKIAIAVNTRLRADGSVLSESWPLAEGRAKGLRRMIIEADGSGRLERGGVQTDLSPAMLKEERAQFGFYHQLQQAARWCSAAAPRGSTVRVFPGAVATAFRCTGGRLTRAANWVAAEGSPVRQDFRIEGLWHASGSVFPRQMRIGRDGRPYFDLTVTRFEAR